jgi:7-cyano-7-deazaguanine synthase
MNTAIVLISGGIDSATCLSLAHKEFAKIIPIHYNYGQQTADFEQEQAENIVTEFQSRIGATVDDLTVVNYESVFDHFAGGVASNKDSFVSEDGKMEQEDGRSTGYQPMRNIHLISTGAAFADVNDADAVFHGMQAGDEADYPDCRPVFRDAVENAVNKSLADNDSVEVRAPLLELEKYEVIELGEEYDVPWEYTYSCYEAVESDDPTPCGQCPACIERAEGFLKTGVNDPFGTVEAVKEKSPDLYQELSVTP